MTTETRKRIRAYKRMLPELRERVVAVALLLAMSASMMGTASYAWITLSRAPEVTGMQTTVAANGNLEIALASGFVKDGLVPPAESAIGDSGSSDRENWTMVNANTTWGNLVNISDPIYGLDQIVLRPALLDDNNLATKPLTGASYGKDGRVIDTIQEYGYASIIKIGDKSYEFAAGDKTQYGVRAISSMITDNRAADVEKARFETNIRRAYSQAATDYRRLVSDGSDVDPKTFKGKSAVKALEGMVSVFANDRVSDGDSSYDGSIWYMHQMMIELKRIMEECEGEALLNLANLQAYNTSGNLEAYSTLDDLIAAHDANALGQITLKTLDSFVTDYKKLTELINDMQPLADSCHPDKVDRPDVKWSQIDDEYINPLVNISTATIESSKLSETYVISMGMGSASKLLFEKNAKIRIYDGIIKNMEARMIPNTSRLNASVAVTAMGLSVGGTVFTKVRETAAQPACNEDTEYTFGMGSDGVAGEEYAKDTYGMAIDLWLRTNVPDTILTLEGTTIFVDEPVIFEQDGKKIQIWELIVEVEEAVEQSDIYQNPDDGKWYYYHNHEEVDEQYFNAGTKKEKVKKVPVGYEGENRIWEDWESLLNLGYIAEDATTQGSGSCFVFYASNPAEQAKMLKLLSAISIVFVDDTATKIATAQLDIENAYINQGKITAPLVITDKGVDYEDEEGNSQKGIMKLPQNKPVWLSAIMYIDGEQLRNENVLADNNIVGQLNIQFGNNLPLGEMDVRDDTELQMQHRSLSVMAKSGTVSSNNSEEPINLEYDTNGHQIEVTATVDGDQPERISAAFVRVINDTQGTKGESVDFTRNDNDTWTGVFTLRSPGRYVLSDLSVDGIGYRLKDKTQITKDNHPAVIIDGLSIDYVDTNLDSGIVRTTNKTQPVTVYAKITADPDLTPKAVWAQFFNEDKTKQYNAKLEFDPGHDGGTWVGTANLASSDTYILEFLSIDGEIVEIDALQQTRLECYLGLKCYVDWTGIINEDGTVNKSTDFLYMGEPFNLNMLATITDDSGDPLPPMDGVHLYYRMQGVSDDIDGMHAPMTWNDAGYYTTTLELTQPGEFYFDRMETGGETDSLRVAAYSPTFTARSPVPPSYVEKSVSAQERSVSIDTSNPAEMTVQLYDAQAAVVWAEMEKLMLTDAGDYVHTGELVPVKFTAKESVIMADGTSAMKFYFPLTQDGIWRANRILCQGVYDNLTSYPIISDPANTATYKEPVTSANSYVVNIPENDRVATEVIATVNAQLFYNGTKYYDNGTNKVQQDIKVDFGGTKTNPTGEIFYPHNNAELKLELKDYKGQPIDELSNVKWEFSFTNANQHSYGGYRNVIWSIPNNAVNMVPESGTTYIAPTQTFDVAGDYHTILKADFDLGGSSLYTVEIPVDIDFAVYSVKPSVAITGRTNHGSSTNTPTSATVYFGSSSGACGVTNYSQPNVIITMAGFGKASSAKLTFARDGGGDVLLYTSNGGSSSVDNYSWTANGAVTRWVGYYKSKSAATDEKTAAGTLTANQLILTNSTGKTAYVDISTITISNPS